jgi:hypothetical protein
MKPALLLVDLQRDYLTSSGIQPAADTLIRRSAQLLSEWRNRRWPRSDRSSLARRPIGVTDKCPRAGRAHAAGDDAVRLVGGGDGGVLHALSGRGAG